MLKVAIMQPYFLPYIGYFQLINSVDQFVIYDNIEFTKKGWINRNRILCNGKEMTITLPLKKDSDYLKIVDRRLADTWISDRQKMLNRITESYRKAPFFEAAYQIIEECVLYEDDNLFNFIYHSIRVVNKYLQIFTKIVVSSDVLINHNLKAEKKVIELCRVLNAGMYINTMGGLELYSKEIFGMEDIKLQFLRTGNIIYKQFAGEFIPSLSIMDVMMFNSKEKIREMLLINELI